jgi:hypothetical protein
VPLLDQIQKEMSDMRAEFQERFDKIEVQLQSINGKPEILTGDVLDVRATQRVLQRRVEDIERGTS